MYIFILVFLAILLSTHLFISYFIILSFSIVNYRIFYYVVAFLLSASFILASTLVHTHNNSIIRCFYYLSSNWLWVLSNLFFSFIFICILIIISRFFYFSINLKIATSIAIIISFLFAIYGIYNANNPVIKNVDITIKNLPVSWKSKKVVFISDVHIWAIIREQFFEKITNMINKENPDIVFITGDLFDWTDWELNHMTAYIDKINYKQGIYYVNWNHETYLWNEITKELLSKTKVKILDDKIDLVDWVQIVWVSYLDNRFSSVTIWEKLKKLSTFDKKVPSILLYHVPVFTKEFRDFGINLQLSGHTHKWQIWPFGYITNLIYKGKDYGLVTENDYNIYTTNWVWTWWPPMRVWNTPEIVVLNFK